MQQERWVRLVARVRPGLQRKQGRIVLSFCAGSGWEGLSRTLAENNFVCMVNSSVLVAYSTRKQHSHQYTLCRTPTTPALDAHSVDGREIALYIYIYTHTKINSNSAHAGVVASGPYAILIIMFVAFVK